MLDTGTEETIGIQCQPRCDDPEFRISTTQQMVASCTGALITSFAVTPFDVVKIRMQSQQKNMLSRKCFLYCNGLMEHICACSATDPAASFKTGYQPNFVSGSNGHFTGTIDAFSKITRSEGFRSLWSGLSPTLVLAVPATVAYFVTYENLRLFILDKHQGVQPQWGPVASGATARLLAVTLVSPMELIRTKMQSQRLTYLEIGAAIKSLVHYNGYRGLFRGLGSTLLRDVPFSAIYWTHYEYFKRKFMTSLEPSFGVCFLSGATAGGIAAVITNPFDVVKTHQQIEVGEKVIYSDSPKNGSDMNTVLRRIYARNGLAGLFNGLAPRLIKVAPSCAIMISTFEYGKNFFYRYNIHHARSPIP